MFLINLFHVKKVGNVVLLSSKHEEIIFLRVYLCVYPLFNWDDIVKKMLKVGGLGKR